MIQASKKLFCHVIGNNYLRKVLRKFLINIESTWRRELKEQTPQLTLLHFGRTVRTGGVLEKNLLLKISQCHQETPLLESQEL